MGEDGGEGAAVEGADVVVHVPVVSHGQGVGVEVVGGPVVVSRHCARWAQGDDDARVPVEGLEAGGEGFARAVGLKGAHEGALLDHVPAFRRRLPGRVSAPDAAASRPCPWDASDRSPTSGR